VRGNNFVVFCEMRTGSYNLVSRLDSCADAVCHGEAFKRDRIEVGAAQAPRLRHWTVAGRNRRPGAFLAELRALTPRRHFGFKLFAGHLDWAPGALGYLLAPATRRVVLFRPPLEVYASWLRAQRSGVWTDPVGRAGPPAPPAAPVRFTPESFEAFAARFNRYAAMCRMLAALPGTFVIHYAQTGDPAAMDALLGFLGSASRFAETASGYRRQSAGGLAAAFANWDEFAQARGGLTPLAAGPPPSRPTVAAARAAAEAV
jgi:hypothetical protein